MTFGRSSMAMSNPPTMTPGDPLWSGSADSPPQPPQPPQFVQPTPPPPPPPQDPRNAWQRLPKWAQWTIGLFAGLVVLGALIPGEDKKQDAQTITKVSA